MSRPSFLAGVAASVAASVAALVVPVRAQSQSPSITIDGQPVVFDRPPIVRDGRAFVPLRGVFERLGASVVYDAGRITATRDETTIALRVGSTQALIDAHPAELEDPPFVTDGRVLVPLRFVSTALGARVDYDAAKNAVAITIPRGRGALRFATGRRGYGGGMLDLQPPSDGTAGTQLDRIGATFAADIRPDSLNVRFDGADVTKDISVSGRRLNYPLPGRLNPGLHNVAVEALTVDGQPVHTSWSFDVR